jgi:predicted SprT family Zn-dependent metalloprotease
MKQNPYTPFRALEVQCTSCGYNVKSPKVTMADRFAKGKFLCKKCKNKLKKGKKK